MTDILVYTEEQGNVIAGSVQPDRMTVAVLGAVGGGTGGSGAVSSVNGQIGHVVLDAADVGADPAGTGASAASTAVAAHVAAADPHTQYTTAAEAAAAAPVQSVNDQIGHVVLDAADVGADAAGTAAAAVSAHEADTTPHAVITQVDKFGFDTAAAQTAGVGEMVWNTADGTADLGLPGGVTLQVGQEQLIRVLNKTGSTIQNMHVVYITGAQGNRVTAAQAQANSTSADKTLAVATQDIANNAEGFATLQGLVRDVNTSAWAEGTELWLSAGTAGAITNVRPTAPNHQVRVGYVVRSHASAGSIYVTVNVGADLGHLHDVVITAPADGDVLIYDTTTQTWQNGPQTGGSGEVNTASNLGAGAGVFASKVAADLQFKSLVAGANVSITSNATTVTISATGGGGGAVDSVNGQTGAVVLDTDDISEGVSNLYFTNARASAAAPVQSVNGQTGAVDLSGSYAPLSHVGSGGAAHANVVAGGAAGFMTGSDKSKLDGIAPGATANANTDSLAEGPANKYFTEGRVRSTVLTGLSLLTGGVISAADSVLSALGKLQKQISDAVTAIGGKQDALVSGTNLKTVNGNSLLGAGDLTISGSGMANPMTTAGDLIVGGAAGVPNRLPVGATGKVLGVTAGSPAWVDPPASGAALPAVRAITGNETLGLANINTFGVNSTTSNYTSTIPAQATVTWTADAELHFLPSNTGGITITAAAGVSLNGVVGGSLTLSTKNGAATLKRTGADSWWLGGVIGTTAEQRAALGLGTAATANLTTSTTDTTAGRLLKVGDFGLGTDNQISVTGDVNNIRYGSMSSPVSQPNTPAIECSLLALGRTGGARASQFAIDYAVNTRAWIRGYNNGRVGAEWAPWCELWTSASANAVTVDTGSFGYGKGSGGAVTQATSKATAVTLNKPSGQITTASNAIAANSVVSFTLTNNKIGANDLPKVVINSGATAGAYIVQVDAVAAGSCRISIRNMTGGSLSETLVLQFNIEKGATA